MEPKEALLKNLTDTTALLKDISIVEGEKFQAATKNHIFEMEESIKKEQAFLLHSKGLEQKRAQLLKQLDAEGLTLRQFIETLPAAERPPFRDAFDKLTEAISAYQKIHHQAKTIIELNLHRIQTKLEQMTGEPIASGTPGYAEHGERLPGAKSLTSRRI